MINILTELEERTKKALQEAFGREDILPEVTPSTQPQFGDYQCNNALKLAKELKLSPRGVAEKIVSHFNRLGITKIEIAGPGFLNITLDPVFIADQLTGMLHDPHLGVPYPDRPQKVIVEFSSPNVAKELHVGHLRSTIIGDALARCFEFLGHDVLRLNHIGDWGTQFGMLIAYMRRNAALVLEGKQTADLPTLMQWYRASKQLFDADAEFKKEAQLSVVKLQGGDEATLAAWRMICDISRKAYQEIYDLLDIKITERGESFYNPYLAAIVADFEKRGLMTLSEGAKCVYLEGFNIPIIIQKTDGGYNYDTTDLAALLYRVREEKADRIIYVVDAGQSLHFQMVFKAAEKAGFYDPSNVKLEHVPFGVVLGPDGKKFKTRSGETERLIDLIYEGVTHAKKILQERMPELSEKELEQTATTLGIDAIKYADLSSHRIKDYLFSYERMLKFEGNTAAFLLYAYVRIRSIQRKCGKNIPDLVSKGKITLTHSTEISLALHIRQFGETLDIVARDLIPHRLADYLYTLAEKFHAFFRDCRVEGSPEEESRLLLCEACGRVLSKGLEILGLKTLERM